MDNKFRQANPIHMLISTIVGALNRTDLKTVNMDDIMVFKLHARRCGFMSTPAVEAVLAEFKMPPEGGEIGKSLEFVINAAHYYQSKGLFTLSEAGTICDYINQIVKLVQSAAPPTPQAPPTQAPPPTPAPTPNPPAPTPQAPPNPPAADDDDEIEVVHIKRK